MTTAIDSSSNLTAALEAPAPIVAPQRSPREPSDGALKHMPQLDGLRAIAIFGVLVTHFLTKYETLGMWGPAGVRLFFVLSGFLITGILLECRRTADSPRDGISQPRLFELRQFYIRRALRIFPLFYAVVIVAAILNRDVRAGLPWHLAYLSNVYLTKIHNWILPGGHLWSLSVEEQFYLVWPWLILFLPRRVLGWAIVLTICVGPAFRWILFSHDPNSAAARVLTPACLDSLGLGALLAMSCSRTFGGTPARRDWLCRIALVAGLAIFAIYVVLKVQHSRSTFRWAGFDCAIALISTWLVGRAALGFRGPFGWFLQWGPVMYIGKISYGLYLIHKFICPTIDGPWPNAHHWPLTRFVLLCAVSIGLASLSFFFFERPINNLKRYFSYARANRPRESDAPAAVTAGA